MANPRGRPPLPDHVRMDSLIVIRLTRAERKLIEQAATVTAESDSSWARAVLIRAAREIQKIPKSALTKPR